MRAALALSLAALAALCLLQGAASAELSDRDMLALWESAAATDASLLGSSQIIGGCNNMTCCNGHRCPHDNGICCADNHSCCPAGFICLRPPPPTACHPERVCGAYRCALAPTPGCGCQGTFNCKCNPGKRKSKNEAVVQVVKNITLAMTGPVTDDDVIDVVSFVSAGEVAEAMIGQKKQGEQQLPPAPTQTTNGGKLRVIPLIVALPSPPQEPLSNDDILKAREDQAKRDEFDLTTEQHKQTIRAEEFAKQMKLKDDEAANKALIIKITREKQVAQRAEQLKQVTSDDSFQQASQVKADLAAVAAVGQEAIKVEQQQQLAMAAAEVHISTDDGTNSDAALQVKKHKIEKQARRHEELDNILEEITQLKRDMQVMKAMKHRKENYDRIEMIKNIAKDARDLADRVKALRINPPSLQWQSSEMQELQDMAYTRQQKQERDALAQELLKSKLEAMKAEGLYNRTKEHVVAMAAARK